MKKKKKEKTKRVKFNILILFAISKFFILIR